MDEKDIFKNLDNMIHGGLKKIRDRPPNFAIKGLFENGEFSVGGLNPKQVVEAFILFKKYLEKKDVI